MRTITRRRSLAMSAAATLMSALSPLPLLAQSRSGTAKILCGFPPGDAADIVARQYADKLRGVYAPVVLVDNKAGAGGRTALDALRREPADGSSIILTPSSMLTLAPHVVKGLPYDPLKDFAPISRASINAFALSIGPMVPESVRTLRQFLAWCQANPDKAMYGTSGVGTTMHLLGANFSRLSGVKLGMVPYKGGAPAATDLVGGQVASVISTLPGVMEFARAGRVRILAISSDKRWPGLPEVPTFSEAGFPDMTFVQWFGFFAPAATPASALAQVHAAIRAAAQTPDVAKTLEGVGLAPAWSESPSEFAASVRADHERWSGIVKAIGFKQED